MGMWPTIHGAILGTETNKDQIQEYDSRGLLLYPGPRLSAAEIAVPRLKTVMVFGGENDGGPYHNINVNGKEVPFHKTPPHSFGNILAIDTYRRELPSSEKALVITSAYHVDRCLEIAKKLSIDCLRVSSAEAWCLAFQGDDFKNSFFDRFGHTTATERIFHGRITPEAQRIRNGSTPGWSYGENTIFGNELRLFNGIPKGSNQEHLTTRNVAQVLGNCDLAERCAAEVRGIHHLLSGDYRLPTD